jgi:ABC-type phosphate/phosphonate transport system ATPase subunit
MITLSKVSKWYPNFQVLKHCSTEVAKGEVVVVCGPSGSGKSTLIKCAMGSSRFRKAPSRSPAFPSATATVPASHRDAESRMTAEVCRGVHPSSARAG